MVDYDNFASTFSKSRKNMKWPEIDYFMDFIKSSFPDKTLKVLDIWCWNWRLVDNLWNTWHNFDYLWTDLSKSMVEEAKKNHPKSQFIILDMLDLDKLEQSFDLIFFIASFHHLKDRDSRIRVLEKAWDLLEAGGCIFMTNWNLLSNENLQKYWGSRSWERDFDIKIWQDKRYYHCFSLEELKELAEGSWFKLIENRLFDWDRNMISILQKPL